MGAWRDHGRPSRASRRGRQRVTSQWERSGALQIDVSSSLRSGDVATSVKKNLAPLINEWVVSLLRPLLPFFGHGGDECPNMDAALDMLTTMAPTARSERGRGRMTVERKCQVLAATHTIDCKLTSKQTAATCSSTLLNAHHGRPIVHALPDAQSIGRCGRVSLSATDDSSLSRMAAMTARAGAGRGRRGGRRARRARPPPADEWRRDRAPPPMAVPRRPRPPLRRRARSKPADGRACVPSRPT